MKKQLCLLLVLLLLGVAGCSSVEEEATAQDSPELEAGQQEVYGKVITAYGNEITIAVGTVEQSSPGGFGGMGMDDAEGGFPGDMDGGFPGDMNGDGQQAERGSRSGSDSGGRSGGMQGGNGSGPPQGISMDGNSGEMPEGGPGRDSSGMEGGPGGNRVGGMGGSVLLTYDGEERTYQIPVTATITTGQGEASRTVRFTQIGYKNVVRLVVDETSQVVSVQILE